MLAQPFEPPENIVPKDLRISYAITVCNEVHELQRLVGVIEDSLGDRDEIVILFDDKGDMSDTRVNELRTYLAELSKSPRICVETDQFTSDFAAWKNRLNSFCGGAWIFNIDADEVPDRNLLRFLPMLIRLFAFADLIKIPRVNTVTGLSPDDIKKWSWKVNQSGWVNWPDYQGRLYKNKAGISWQGNVHENVMGARVSIRLPRVFGRRVALHHPKTIDRQRQQNALYDNIETGN